MRKFFRWLDRQTKERPFFSALIVLLLVVVPGYTKLENTANSASNAAQSAATTAKEVSDLVEKQDAQDKAATLANCQTRNTASKNGRDRFKTFFDALEVLIISPQATPDQQQQAKQFIDNLRAAVPLDPTKEDIDCNLDNQLNAADYAT